MSDGWNGPSKARAENNAGWVNLPRDGNYEVQENIFNGAFRHRVHRPDMLFHEWFDGKPPYKPLKDSTKD